MWREPVRFLSKFVGRKTEVDRVIEFLKAERLVTIHATGGIGKTRVAAEAASRISGRFDDGATFVGLAALLSNSEQALVSEVIARREISAAGFKSEADALVAHLRGREMLLVLDNFEAVLAGAPFVRTLLKTCPALRILITSQRPSGVDGEQLYALPPMATPPVETATSEVLEPLDAFKLFEERAQHAKFDWKLTNDNSKLVAEILTLTEGIPLAIKLAAAQVRNGLPQIRDGLKKEPLRFLKGGTDEDKRHASMQACLEWSYGLLGSSEKSLFAALSVFAGGFYAEDVGQVCQLDNAQDLMEALRDASLIESVETAEGFRCRMLQVVRKFASEKLGDRTEQLKRSHAAHFLKVLTEADEQLSKNQQAAGFARIDADYENFVAGLKTSEEFKSNTIVNYVSRLSNYLTHRGRSDQRLEFAQRAAQAALPKGDPHITAANQNNLGNAYCSLPTGDRGKNLKRAIESYQAALRVSTESDFPLDFAMTQNNLGTAYCDLPTGDRGKNLEHAIACFEAALRVYTERDFPLDWAMTQNNLGTAYRNLRTGDRGQNLERAIACYEAALRVYTERDFPLDWAMTQNNLGIAYRNLPTEDRGKNLERAIACYEAALRVYTEHDFPLDWATTQNNLGTAYRNLRTGDRGQNLERAIACYEAALRVYTERDFPLPWATTQNNLGIAYRELLTGDRGKNLERAIECYLAAARGFTAVGMLSYARNASDRASALKKQIDG